MKKLFIFVFFVQLMLIASAQMNDQQVVNLLQDAHNNGMNQQEMVNMLIQKGVSQDQLIRIKNNHDANGMLFKKSSSINDRTREQNADNKAQNEETLVASQQGKEDKINNIFGHNIFNNKSLTFEPNLNVATPETYVLGPGDEVIIDIWGDSEQSLQKQISPDGNITIEKIGLVYLNGMTMQEAHKRLRASFSQIYSTLRGTNPTSHINLSLGKIRSIRINVMGEVRVPGTYTLPSLATLFHAIYSAGGANSIGSLRSIKVSRGGKEVADIDIYEYLLKGESSLDIRLQDGDVIIVAPYQSLVKLEGKVKRPMMYEMKNTETLADILNYSGGFTGDAYKETIRVIRKNGRGYKVFNVEAFDFENFTLADEDIISIDPIINTFENRLEIKGAVLRPGLYALNENTQTVMQLVKKAEGIKGDAFLDRTLIYRVKPDLTLEVLAVDLKGIINGKSADIELKCNDVLYIPSIFDLNEEYTITVAGAIGIPGTYRYVSGMTIEDLIVQAGGLKEAASHIKIDVARRIKNPKSISAGNLLTESFTLTLKDGLLIDGEDKFTLMPFDQVYIRKSPGYQTQQNVEVRGEILFEGLYALSTKAERVSDLIKKSGGLTPEAYAKGARLVRQMNSDERKQVETLLKLSKHGGRDSIDISRLDIGNTYYVGIELDKILENPGSEYDVVLRENDRLEIPQYSGTVKISGGVMYPNTVVYKKNAGLKHYIEQGGGYGDRAKKRKVFVVHMNGTITKSRTLAKAKASPGSEIIVPIKSIRKGLGLAEVMSIATSTTSMAALVTSIINNTK